MSEVRERKRKMVRGLNNMYFDEYKRTGAQFILGTAEFIGNTVAKWL
jgi:pyruvate/2-oxoglutarate dehydrogenase complex dihydrolipoamide dehydrogenase (E3) component